MTTQRPDKIVHLRLTPATQRALAAIEQQIQADPVARALLRVQGSERVPVTRVIQYALGMVAEQARPQQEAA